MKHEQRQSLNKLSHKNCVGRRLAVRLLGLSQTRRFIPAPKENNHEAGRTKKLPEAQESKEAPYYEEVHRGEEIKGR
jgi:hypothetical protein